jgi:hypothetical protein
MWLLAPPQLGLLMASAQLPSLLLYTASVSLPQGNCTSPTFQVTAYACSTPAVGYGQLFYVRANTYVTAVTVMVYTGYCSNGYYSTSVGTVGNCAQTPAGYYKPYASFSNNYYICGVGYYSLAGATACAACPSATDYGMTFCLFPTGQPTSQPSTKPSSQPTSRPTHRPSAQPSSKPSNHPSSRPTVQPSSQPSSRPSSQPIMRPSAMPTNQPTSRPSRQPTGQPTRQPSGNPSSRPSAQPTRQPSSRPSSQPSSQPSMQPSRQPSAQPTGQPTSQPSSRPTRQPTSQPSSRPTSQPSSKEHSQSSQLQLGAVWPKGGRDQYSRGYLPVATSVTSTQSLIPVLSSNYRFTSGGVIIDKYGFIYAGDEGGNLYCINPQTLALQWTFSNKSCVMVTVPLINKDSIIYVLFSRPYGNPGSNLYAIHSVNGTMSWRYVVPSYCQTALNIGSDGSIYFPCVDKYLYAISSSGSLTWKVFVGSSPTAVAISYSGTLWIGNGNGYLFAFSSAGILIYNISLTVSGKIYAPNSETQPVIDESNYIYITGGNSGTGTGLIFAIDGSTGSIHGHNSLPDNYQRASPSIWGNYIFVGCGNFLAYQFALVTLTLAGSYSCSDPICNFYTGNAVIDNQGNVLIGSENWFYSLKSTTGGGGTMQVNWHVQASDEFFGRPAIGADGSIYIGNLNKVLYKIQGTAATCPTGKGISQTWTATETSVRCDSCPAGRFSYASACLLCPSGTYSSVGQSACFVTSSPSPVPTASPTRQPTNAPTIAPTVAPTSPPTQRPSSQPTSQPTSRPTIRPTAQPTRQPTTQPSSVPTGQPSKNPSSRPSGQPTSGPSSLPTTQPTGAPSSQPTSQPTMRPSRQPTAQPSAQPTSQPTSQPTGQPSSSPSQQPSGQPTGQPTLSPTTQPTFRPSGQPTGIPTSPPTMQPSLRPSTQPSPRPTTQPTSQPTYRPFSEPSSRPSTEPTSQPTSTPSREPTTSPSADPTNQPSQQPTRTPTSQPTAHPSVLPSGQPSTLPSLRPTSQPSMQPTSQPTVRPTAKPSLQPTMQPSSEPTRQPTSKPSLEPSRKPTTRPTAQPSAVPSRSPSNQPTAGPSSQPTARPSTQPTADPSNWPSCRPSSQPTLRPSATPSRDPTSQPTRWPSGEPSMIPSTQPTSQPSERPSRCPSAEPTNVPSGYPTRCPSGQPSNAPSSVPTMKPSVLPTSQPTRQPTSWPSHEPTSNPSIRPSPIPTSQPTMTPSHQPTAQPSRQPSVSPFATPTAQPTRIPSRAPTSPPSVLPSTQPTVFPISQPTAGPSTQPTSQPSQMPSVHPTDSPTTRPSGQPTSFPLHIPTSKPSNQSTAEKSRQSTNVPSSLPTVQPSGRPSATPLWKPSTRPSNIPSAQPTSQPSRGLTACPSGHPSRVPSTAPTGQPSNRPSPSPSKRPLSRPLNIPTELPSKTPSSHPSSRPSRKPTAYPTSAPTRRSSSQPSSRPSRRPSSQPSTQPSRQPVSHPTSRPSVLPTANPVPKGVTKTSRPSVTPTCVPPVTPTATPTHPPTLSLSAQWSVRLNALLAQVSAQITSSSVTYSDAFVNGSGVETYTHTCSTWNQFYSKVLGAGVSKELVKLTLAYTFSLNVSTTTNTLASCVHTSSLLSLQEAIVNGSTVPASCGGDRWSVGSCSGKFAMCVNCSEADVTANYASSFNPCTSNHNSSNNCLTQTDSFSGRYASFARVLIATFAVVAPAVESLTITARRKNSVTVSVQLDQYGAAYCAAFTLTATPTAVQFIVSVGNLGWTTNDLANVTVLGLAPVTDYYIYCVAMSKQGQISDLSTAIRNRLHVTTTCCRIITFKLITKDIFQDSTISALATLTASSLPASALTVSLSAACRNDTGIYSESILFPPTLTLGSSSAVTSEIAFKGASYSAICNITGVLGGVAASDFEIVYSNGFTLRVLNHLSVPVTPSISTAQFSADGSLIALTFDSQTDKGRVISTNNFVCSLLVVFVGASHAKCQWNTEATIVTISPNVMYPLVPGSQISVRANKIRAACPAAFNSSTCAQWSTIANTSLSILSPTNPTVPTVRITLPSTIGSCDSLSLDIGSSTGSGGRVWSTANVSLISTKASNTSGLTGFLARSSILTSSRLTIASGLLSKGKTYTFTATLCNFLGACGSTTASVNVLNLMLPVVSIIGGPTFSVRANSSLSLSSSAFTASCDGSQSFLNLEYAWSIYLLNESTVAALSLTSISRDPSKYILRAYQLSPSSSYEIQLTVTNKLSLKSSSTAVVVMVPVSNLIVLITGGKEQSVKLAHSFVVDASGSFDSDQTDKGTAGVHFSWKCSQSSPTYSLLCPLKLWNTNSSVLSGFANTSAANSSSVIYLSMYDATRVATAEVELTVLPAAYTLVRIATTFTNKVQSASSLILQGSVGSVSSNVANGYGEMKCVWSVDDGSIDLTISSYVPPTQIISMISAAYEAKTYLSLAPYTLPTGSSLTFTLACAVLDSVSLNTVSASYASITVSVNAPPTPGTCVVTPALGFELLTPFQMSASFWVDDDTPISYEFGFISSSTNVTLVLQTKGLSSVANAYLAAGSSSKNYSTVTSFQVFDSFGASATEYVTVRVMSLSLNRTTVNSKTTTLLSEATGYVDGMKQIISVVATAVTRANCSLAPSCAALNRLDCMSIDQTCGACLSDDYVGVSGASNTMCVLASAYYQSVSQYSPSDSGSCDSSVNCSAWSVCEETTRTCVPAPKVCVSKCTSPIHGACAFVQINSIASLSACDVSDPLCKAVCVCSSGYYGDDCSLDEADVLAIQETTSQLMQALLQVSNLETLDSQSSIYLSNALLSLTARSYLLTEAAATIAYNISTTILQPESTLSLSTVTTLSTVVDNLLGSSYLTSLSARRRRLVDTASNATVGSLLDSVSNAVVSQMVAGQDSRTILQSNYRLSANIISTSTSVSNLSIASPRTALESLSNVSDNCLLLSDVSGAFGVNENVGLGLISIPQYLVDVGSYANQSTSSSALAVSNVSVTSNALQLTLQIVDFSSSCSAGDMIFTFAHNHLQAFGVESSMNITNTTRCVHRVSRTVWVYCPGFDQQIPVYCNGSLASHTIVTTCPTLLKSPTCLLTATDGDQIYCDVLHYTDASTTCRCSSCLFAGTTRRRLQSSASTYGTEILALSEYSFSEYVSVMESASSFDTVSALKDTLLIVITFALMWLGTIAGICGKEYYRWHRSLIAGKLNKSKKAGSVVPQSSHGPSADNKPVASKRKRSATATPFESLKYNSLEDCLKDYIYELFSPAFSDDSETVRLARELWNKHEYVSVLTQKEFGMEQWIAVFCLLTNLNANFFLLALFYDIQFFSQADKGFVPIVI